MYKALAAGEVMVEKPDAGHEPLRDGTLPTTSLS